MDPTEKPTTPTIKSGTLLISAKIVETESKLKQINKNQQDLDLLLKKLTKILRFRSSQ